MYIHDTWIHVCIVLLHGTRKRFCVWLCVYVWVFFFSSIVCPTQIGTYRRRVFYFSGIVSMRLVVMVMQWHANPLESIRAVESPSIGIVSVDMYTFCKNIELMFTFTLWFLCCAREKFVRYTHFPYTARHTYWLPLQMHSHKLHDFYLFFGRHKLISFTIFITNIFIS